MWIKSANTTPNYKDYIFVVSVKLVGNWYRRPPFVPFKSQLVVSIWGYAWVMFFLSFKFTWSDMGFGTNMILCQTWSYWYQNPYQIYIYTLIRSWFWFLNFDLDQKVFQKNDQFTELIIVIWINFTIWKFQFF